MDRFQGLEPALWKIALNLEQKVEEWEKTKPPHLSLRGEYIAWSNFSRACISELSTDQIQALAEWLTNEGQGDDTPVHNYRNSLYFIWASRDPIESRAHVLALAQKLELLGNEVNQWKNIDLDEVSESFDHIQLGHALNNPEEAWQQYLNDVRNPRLETIVGETFTISNLFEIFSSLRPDQAWDHVLHTKNPAYYDRMLKGFTAGAPAGQDWKSLAQELATSLIDRNLKPTDQTYHYIAERWATEDHTAALDWFASHVPFLERSILQVDPLSPVQTMNLRPARTPGEALIVKTRLLLKIFDSHDGRSHEVITILSQFIQDGNVSIPNAVLNEASSRGGRPEDIPIINLIPLLPDPEIRNKQIMQLAGSLTARGGRHTTPDPTIFDYPNPQIIAVRNLAAELKLSSDIQAQVDEALKKVNSQEQENRLRMEKEDAHTSFN